MGNGSIELTGEWLDARDRYRDLIVSLSAANVSQPPVVGELWKLCGLTFHGPKHWCGAKCLAEYITALPDATRGVKWGFDPTPGFAGHLLTPTRHPERGDLVIFRENWHHATLRPSFVGNPAHTDPNDFEPIRSAPKNENHLSPVWGGRVYTCDGNQGHNGATKGPGICKFRVKDASEVYCFYSINKWLDVQIEADARRAYDGDPD